MLTRLARRNARLDTIRNYNLTREQLYLPWLCPTYTHSRQARRSIVIDSTSNPPSIRKRRNSGEGNASTLRRSLATAVDVRFGEEIPFEGLEQSIHGSGFRNPDLENFARLTQIRPFDPSNALVLNEPQVAPQRHRMVNGIGGEVNEMLLMLDACLQVGRLDRAGVIIRRVASLHTLDEEQLLTLHNQFLKTSVQRLMAHPSDAAAQAIHKWFEIEIRNRNLPIGAETMAYMLKASLQSPPGPRCDRLVRRYMEMAPGDVGLKVLSMMDIMSAQELDTINQIAPEHNILANMEIFTEKEFESSDDPLITDIESPNSKMKTTPEVRPTPQKGLGLKSLKKALSLFSDKPSGFNPDSLSLAEQHERQKRLEDDAVRSAIDRWRDESVSLSKMGLDTSLQTKSIGARMWKWQEALEETLKAELQKIDEAESSTTRGPQESDRCTYGPFLRYLPLDKLAAVTILTTMTTLSTQGVDKGIPLATLILNLGKAIEDESMVESVRQNTNLWEQLNIDAKNSDQIARLMKHKETRQQVVDSLAKLAESKTENKVTGKSGRLDPEWSGTIKAKVGAILFGALLQVAKIPVTREHPETKEMVMQVQPAFSHAHQYRLGKKTGMVLANSALVAQLKREPVHSLLAKHLPMVVEPQSWARFNEGGFISQPAKVMRVKLGDKDQRYYAEAAIGRGDMEQMFKGLDVLGKTPWRVNRPVFDTMLEAWNSGEPIANIPPENPKLEYPSEPEASTDPSARRAWIRAVKDIENLKGGYHSQRCFQNFQLEIARALVDEKFYFPHNVDFRGRAYPIPPYLNHMGADHCRGLLKFAEGKEVGQNGLRWLRIHLANVFGYDKASLTERENFAIEHTQDIMDSATNPLKGNRWWLKAEDPWQCLAACHELKDALAMDDPTKFKSQLPIHQDGTCNGLQHYAALGGDTWGARQVNLEPGDRPADVYSAVADLVKEAIKQDLKTNHPCAKFLEGKITRKVVKQTVMTNVYGVTFIGARAQVRKQLVAAYGDIMPDTPEFHPGTLASYVATRVFKALGTMFKGAHDIQYWLGECAGRITTSISPEQLDRLEQLAIAPDSHKGRRLTKHQSLQLVAEDQMQFKTTVVWTNPLRMPIVQPYRTSQARMVTTNLQKISISEPHRSDPVNKRKQLQAFPPNFIHSLDATHMILSALRCHELDLSFAAVHDSFWTHAADVEKMNEALRDAFIRMHSEDIVGRLRAEFEARYKGSIYFTNIKPGTEFYRRVAEWRHSQRATRDLPENVLNSKTLLRKNMRLREALLERKRLRLLSSEDPAEIEEGKKMVTPGSIFEELAAVKAIEVEDLGAVHGLGDMTSRQSADDDEELAAVSEEDVNVELDEEGELVIPRKDVFARTMEGKKRKQVHGGQWAWLPLTFPEVPKKGDFDVSRLKDSKYFFS